VGNCCRARSCEQFFKPSVARRSLEAYRKKGLDQLERQMIASVSVGALDDMRVLEIGGGIGLIQAELLAAGADQGEVVELVAAYEPYARELARETRLEGRTSFHIVDILEEPDAVESADIVVLNRVVCCSPDGVDLAAAAARLARRTLVLSFPRDVIWVRAGIRLLNASLRLRRSPFRAYVHQPDALFAAANSGGLHVGEGGHGVFWQWAALERTA
jgi:magnesium-protoporphyrin O-methyltransferase